MEADLVLTEELIDDVLNNLREKHRTEATVQTYRAKLRQFYDWLPEGKQVGHNTLESWRQSLLTDGYAPRTINVCVSAANTLLEVCGHRELQVGKPLEAGAYVQPELTRNEYLRLLSTARILGKEREYLIIKVFVATGILIQDLPRLTVEVVSDGKLPLSNAIVHIPECLRRELLDYARREGIPSGPLFVTPAGTPYPRTSVTNMIQRLCRDAQVSAEKCTPRCLRKLYQTTQANIYANIALLAEQSHDRLLETEQLAIGWSDGNSPRVRAAMFAAKGR